MSNFWGGSLQPLWPFYILVSRYPTFLIIKSIQFRHSHISIALLPVCTACNSEFPTYIDLYNKYHEKGFSIVGISIDSSPSNIQAWKEIIKTKPLHWTQYRANEKTIDDLRINYYPSNFLIDSSRKIIAINLGSKEVADLIRAKLN